MSLWLMRVFLLLAVLVSVFYVRPFGGDNNIMALVFGVVFGVLVILAEFHIRKLEVKSLLGAVVGAFIGAIGANMISLVISRMNFDSLTADVTHILILIAMIYLGLICGAYGGNRIKWTPTGGIFTKIPAVKPAKFLTPASS